MAKYIKDGAEAAGTISQRISDQTNSNNSSSSQENCYACNKQQSLFNTYGNMYVFERCCVCYGVFCYDCFVKSKWEVPTSLLYGAYNNPILNEENKDKESSKSISRPICNVKCLPKVLEYAMERFTQLMDEQYATLLLLYINGGEEPVSLFDLPGSNKDTTARMALRYSSIAQVVAEFSGFTMTYKAVEYAYMGKELMSLLIASDTLTVLNPLLASLKSYGITGPTALTRVYYLGCKHVLEAKIRTKIRDAEFNGVNMEGVLSNQCPLNILKFVSKYVTAAQWLYVSNLPAPHDNSEWGSWYLSLLLAKQEWSLLMCVQDTTKLPNGRKCAAFGLVARKRKNPQTGIETREALLLIRGSKSAMDWTINFSDEQVPFQYHLDVYSDNNNNNNNNNIDGRMHRGMYESAIGILDGYAVRSRLVELALRGYSIRVIGHSLGAGVACIIAAEMRNYLRNQNNISKIISSVGTNSRINFSMLVNNFTAITYASPPCVSGNLSHAFMKDELLVNVVVGCDIVPRLNRANFKLLAQEIITITPQADEWYNKDYSCLKKYLSKFGKAADINEHIAESIIANAPSAPKDIESDELNANNNNLPEVGPGTKPPKPIKGNQVFPSDNNNNNIINAKEVNNNTTSSNKDNIKQTISSFSSSIATLIPSSLLSSSSEAHVKQEDEKSSHDNNNVSLEESKEEVVLVTPGPIVFIYQDVNSSFRSALITH
eukprot:gene12442-16687_t